MIKGFDRKIVLEDGSEYYGYGFGGSGTKVCELIFNTAMAGYQEMLSDPTCTDLMVVMTYPIIGSYGIADDDFEAKTPTLGGLVVREYNDNPSNFRYTKTLSEILEEHHIPAIEGLDTRMLARHIRDHGVCKAAICDADMPTEEAVALIRSTVLPHDQVSRVSCKKRWYSRTSNRKFDVVAVDCGIKMNIIRMLNKRGCNVTVVPFDTPAEVIESMNPDGVLISNGPGAPEDVPEVVELIRQLRGKYPMFGISLGHLLIARAYGAKTCQMKFGHHGGNHPVKELKSGKLFITSQGHGHAVDAASLEETDLEITYVDMLDQTVEGLACPKDHVFSVQFHPESAPGPHDCEYLFDQFVEMMKEVKTHA